MTPASALRPALLLGFLCLPALAQGPPKSVELRVGCVLASNSGHDFDQRLVSLEARFQRLFRYTSYSLLKEKRARVPLGSKMGFDVPGGRYLVVTPKALRPDGRLSLGVLLLDGARPIVHTDVSLRMRSTFLVAGPQSTEGALILAIAADNAE
ncbi:MAG: hypothetical protein KatS3mg076_1779 [Candidatus Binatia bacterium]|nr:MAG: hypothetical protein KatS3mg076_1779 [Candidatus Binatia bacterium]